MENMLLNQQNAPEGGPQMDEAQMQQMMEAMSSMDMEQLMQNMPPEMVEMMRQMYDPAQQQ